MPKSAKITVAARVNDAFRLLLVGAEFADIRQYASEHDWGVSDRQVRRYVEMAHKRFAKASQRDRKQLLGRHLAQRRALYARAIKSGDLRSALQVLRDEAALEGLYPNGKPGQPVADGQFLYSSAATPPLSRRERVVRLLSVETKGDYTERRLLEHATPWCVYHLRDTMMPTLMLHLMTLMYVTEQLESAFWVANSMFCAVIDGDADGQWDDVGVAAAYRFRIGHEAWAGFTTKLGVDGDRLVRGNYLGNALVTYGSKICDLAPTFEEAQVLFQRLGQRVGRTDGSIATAATLEREWRELFDEVCRE